jgi:16S rRNA (uracil1498-N3)-methyltransferase
MVERGNQSRVISLFADEQLAPNAEVQLDEDAVSHVRARRAVPGAAARVINGRGTVAEGRLETVERHRVSVLVTSVEQRPAPERLEVLVPVADKDRMLMAAEKCAELQITHWRPVVYERSRSVSPRGEGPRFREKVLARMRAALEQSGGAWLPEVLEEAELETALDALRNTVGKLVLDSSGTLLHSHMSQRINALAVGPEGGFSAGELALATDSGWTAASLGPTTLRFETAVIAGVAVIRVTPPRRSSE